MWLEEMPEIQGVAKNKIFDSAKLDFPEVIGNSCG
jgi:hypothetical protein